MTDLLKALYAYANENRMVYNREDRLQIKESNRVLDRLKQRLAEHMSEKDQELFESYIGEEELKECMEREAIFRAGLSIGLELSRL